MVVTRGSNPGPVAASQGLSLLSYQLCEPDGATLNAPPQRTGEHSSSSRRKEIPTTGQKLSCVWRRNSTINKAPPDVETPPKVDLHQSWESSKLLSNHQRIHVKTPPEPDDSGWGEPHQMPKRVKTIWKTTGEPVVAKECSSAKRESSNCFEVRKIKLKMKSYHTGTISQWLVLPPPAHRWLRQHMPIGKNTFTWTVHRRT